MTEFNSLPGSDFARRPGNIPRVPRPLSLNFVLYYILRKNICTYSKHQYMK